MKTSTLTRPSYSNATIVSSLINSEDFASKFFFPSQTESNLKVSFTPIACSIAQYYAKSFKIRINPDDLATTVYTHLWAGGTWEPLLTYHGKSSFFTWLRKVSKNCAGEMLVKEGFLPKKENAPEHDSEHIMEFKTSHDMLIKKAYTLVEESDDPYPIFNKLGIDPTDPYADAKVKKFLKSFTETHMKRWTSKQFLIWESRLLDNISPEEVAEMVNAKRCNIDTTFSRLNNKFRKAIRKELKKCNKNK